MEQLEQGQLFQPKTEIDNVRSTSTVCTVVCIVHTICTVLYIWEMLYSVYCTHTRSKIEFSDSDV